MNQFTETYKEYSNTDLLRVIENKSDYQLEAIEAAESELTKRDLSDSELSKAKNELSVEQQAKKKLIKKKKEFQLNLRNIVNSIFDIINPLKKGLPKVEIQIRLIVIVFGLLAFYQWFREYDFIKYLLNTNDSIGWDLSMVAYFLPLIIFPIATLLFWTRIKVGWVLLVSYLIYITVNNIGLLKMAWDWEPAIFPVFDELFPTPSLSSLIFNIIFYGGTLWVLAKNEMIKYFQINRWTYIGTYFLATILTITYVATFF